MITTFWPNSKGKSATISNINGLSDSAKIAEFLNEHSSDPGKRVQEKITRQSTLNDFPSNLVPSPCQMFLV